MCPLHARQRAGLRSLGQPIEKFTRCWEPAWTSRQFFQTLLRGGVDLTISGEALSKVGRDDAESPFSLEPILVGWREQPVELDAGQAMGYI